MVAGGEDMETEAMQQEKRSEEEETKPGRVPDREEVQHGSPDCPPAGREQLIMRLQHQAVFTPNATLQ